MCIAITVDKDKTPPTKDVLSYCFSRNSHGAGFAYAPGDGKVHVHKGLMTFNEFWDKYSATVPKGVPHVIHFRLATSGLKEGNSYHPGCTHPFPVTTHVDSLYMTDYTFKGDVIVHNGIFTGKGDDIMSDTQEAVVAVAAGQDTWEKLATSSRVASIDPSGKITRWSSWSEDQAGDGVWFSNSGYKPYTYNYGSYSNSSYSSYKAPEQVKGLSGDFVAEGLGELPDNTDLGALEKHGLYAMSKGDLVILANDDVISVADLLVLYGGKYSTYQAATVCEDKFGTMAYLCFSYKRPVPLGTPLDPTTKKGAKLEKRYRREEEKRRAEREKKNGCDPCKAPTSKGFPVVGDTCVQAHGTHDMLGKVTEVNSSQVTVEWRARNGGSRVASTFLYPTASWYEFIKLTPKDPPEAPEKKGAKGEDGYFEGQRLQLSFSDGNWSSGYVYAGPGVTKYSFLVRTPGETPFEIDRAFVRAETPQVGDRYEFLSGEFKGKIGVIYREAPERSQHLYIGVDGVHLILREDGHPAIRRI